MKISGGGFLGLPHKLNKMERETGFEPATSTLEGWHSTTELLPHRRMQSIIVFYQTVKIVVLVGFHQNLYPLNILYIFNNFLKNMVDGKDSNLRRPVGRQIYSLLPLTTRAPVHLFHIKNHTLGD